MATSLEKVNYLVAQLSDATDQDLKEIAPSVPPAMLRPLAWILPRMLPDTDEELEELLDRAHEFIANLRTDPQPAA